MGLLLCLFCRLKPVLTLQKLYQSPTHRTQAKLFCMYILRLKPHTLGCIIACRKSRSILHLAEIEHIERMYIYAAKAIHIWQREEILCRHNLQSGLFHHFAPHSLLQRLAGFHESGDATVEIGLEVSGVYKQKVVATIDVSIVQ